MVSHLSMSLLHPSALSRCKLFGASILVLLSIIIMLSSHTSRVLADDKIKELIKSNGFVEIKIVEAHVPDLDKLPGQGDSDVFVRVYLNDTKELVCETQVVQDENHPKFNKDCRTNRAVPAATVLKFELFDSDKPSPDPDWIGMARVGISELILNRKLDSKETIPIEGRSFPKHYIKVKIDFKPEK